MSFLRRARRSVGGVLRSGLRGMRRDPLNILSNVALPGLGLGLGYLDDQKRRGLEASARAASAAQQEQFGSLLEAVRDEQVDAVTGREITDLLSGGVGNLGRAQELFTGATELTDPKFKARRATQEMFKTVVQQPGRRQLGIGPQTQTRSSFLV